MRNQNQLFCQHQTAFSEGRSQLEKPIMEPCLGGDLADST